MMMSIAFPFAGGGASLRFDFADLESLQATLGVGWWEVAMRAIDAADLVTLKILLNAGVKDGDASAAMQSAPFEEIAAKVLDGLLLARFGRTAAEQLEHLKTMGESK